MLGGRFLPEFYENTVIAHVNAVPGTSLDETARIAARIDEALAVLRLPMVLPALQMLGRVGGAVLRIVVDDDHAGQAAVVVGRQRGRDERVAHE